MHSILIIEDNIYIQTLLSSMVEERGFIVDTSIDGLEGVEKALKNDYSLIVTDMNMPDITGIEVIEKLKAHKGNLPIIAISGGSPFDSEDKGLLCEAVDRHLCDAVFQKPIKKVDFLNTMTSLIETEFAQEAV